MLELILSELPQGSPFFSKGVRSCPPSLIPNKCVGCGTCADICNSNIFVFDRTKDKTPQVKFPDECWHCDSCVIDCPKGAIQLRIPLAFTLLHINADALNPQEAKS